MTLGKAYSKIEQPCLFVLGFGVVTTYLAGVTGAAIPTGWFWLMLTLPILLFFYKADIKTEHLIGFVFLLICAISLIWTIRFNIGLFYFLQFVVCGVAFYIGSAVKNIKPIIYGLAVGILINSIIAIFQYLGWKGIYTNNNNIAGLFVNRNILCEVSVIVLITLIVFKLWWWIPVTLPGVFISPSRTGLLALFVCGVVYLYGHSKKLAFIFLLGCILVGGLYTYLYDIRLGSIVERFDLWRDTVNGLTLFGGGIGSYETLYPKNAILIDTVLQRPKYAHNDILNLVFELGILSVVIIPFFWNISILKCRENYILYAVLIMSMFTYSLHVSATAFIWFIVAGYIVNNANSYKPFRGCRRLVLFERIKNK